LEEGMLEETEGFGGCDGGESNCHGSTVTGENKKKRMKKKKGVRGERM